jgi:hypothetical protein
VPTNLDEMIATALRAEVLLAEASSARRAELNQTRLKVTRDVVGAFNEKQKQNAMVSVEREPVRGQDRLVGRHLAAEVEKVRARLGETELGIAQSDAEIRYLLGVGSQLDPAQVRDPNSTNDRPRKTVPRPDTIPEPLREALARQVNAQFDKTNLGDAMTALSQQSGASIIDHQSESRRRKAKSIVSRSLCLSRRRSGAVGPERLRLRVPRLRHPRDDGHRFSCAPTIPEPAGRSGREIGRDSKHRRASGAPFGKFRFRGRNGAPPQSKLLAIVIFLTIGPR